MFERLFGVDTEAALLEIHAAKNVPTSPEIAPVQTSVVELIQSWKANGASDEQVMMALGGLRGSDDNGDTHTYR